MKGEIICKNCDTKFRGNFCSNCGQSATTHRINAHYFLHDVIHSVFHVDKGLPYTFYQLSINPGKNLLAYLHGKRVRFFKPFAYVVILSTISSLFLKFSSGDKVFEPHNQFLSVFAHYPSLLIFVLIPLVAAVSWIIFRKRNLNYWEHFLVHTYLAAQINVILILVHLIAKTGILDNANMVLKLTLFNLIYMTYHGFTFGVLFKTKEKSNFWPIFEIGFCCAILGFIYATALVMTGVATTWF